MDQILPCIQNLSLGNRELSSIKIPLIRIDECYKVMGNSPEQPKLSKENTVFVQESRDRGVEQSSLSFERKGQVEDVSKSIPSETYKRGLKRKYERLEEECKEQTEKMARLMIEDCMSKAVIRKCWLCRKRYVKEGGCNAVKCICGATTCHHCGLLMSNNLSTVHLRCPLLGDSKETDAAIAAAARATKTNLLQVYPDLTFKYDPSRDIDL